MASICTLAIIQGKFLPSNHYFLCIPSKLFSGVFKSFGTFIQAGALFFFLQHTVNIFKGVGEFCYSQIHQPRAMYLKKLNHGTIIIINWLLKYRRTVPAVNLSVGISICKKMPKIRGMSGSGQRTISQPDKDYWCTILQYVFQMFLVFLAY